MIYLYTDKSLDINMLISKMIVSLFLFRNNTVFLFCRSLTKNSNTLTSLGSQVFEELKVVINQDYMIVTMMNEIR